MESPRAISNAGHIAGVSPVYEEGGYQQMMSFGMVYHQGVVRGVPDALTPDYSTGRWYTFTSPLGVNSAGTVLAQQETNAGSGIYLAVGDSTTLLPMWRGAAINEAGQVAGGALFDNGASDRAVLYDNGNVVDLGTLNGAAHSVASDLNDQGVVVGTSGGRSFVWHDGVMEAFGSLANENARAVNNHGDVIGTFVNGGTGTDYRHSYLYQDGVQYDLQDLLAGGGGWRIADVTDINDSGQIAGRACNGAGQCFAALLVPVPEPATWGMMLAGLAVVGAARLGGLRRRAA
jgi:probable HAF family extracellular repeat protein